MVQIKIQVIGPADGQIHINEPECETRAFSKEFSTDQFHFNFKRKTDYSAEIHSFSNKELRYKRCWKSSVSVLLFRLAGKRSSQQY